MNYKIKLIPLFILFFILSFPLLASAQTFYSNCVVTKVGNPANAPALPPECATGDLTLPPNLGVENPTHPGYFQMPASTDDSYNLYTCRNRNWGSRELISVVYSVAKRWKTKYPQGRINIGDLNAVDHKSHNWGRAVDLDATTNGKDWVSDYTKGSYNRQATIELGQMFVDTEKVLNIWYNDQAVNNAVLSYSKASGKSKGMVMHPIEGHDNHYHLDVRQTPEKLSFWTPDC